MALAAAPLRAALALALLAAPAAAALAPEPFAAGLDRPVFAAAPPGDARLFVVEQPGRIRIVRSDGSVAPTPFLDISAGVLFTDSGEDERGLLGLAFAPDYSTSGHFYVYYVAPPDPGLIVIARATRSAGDPDLADAASLRVLFTSAKPQSAPGGGPEAYHNGGTLAFGPGGVLWAGLGDGGGWFGDDYWNCAQNASSPLGKLLRLDVANLPQTPVQATGTPCPTLPSQGFVSIWARGLRNPYRFSFDRQTGDLWIADVGQSAREEVNVVAAAELANPTGPNFGWRDFEGTFCNPNLPPQPLCNDPAGHRPPVHDYAHGGSGFCSGSITGGVVYRGTDAAVRGQYVFSDWCRRFLRTIQWDGAGGIVPGTILDYTNLWDPTGRVDAATAIVEDGAGELVIVDYGFAPGSGELIRLVPEPGAAAGAGAATAALAARRRRRPAAKADGSRSNSLLDR